MKFKQALLAEPGRFIIQEVDKVPNPDQIMIKIASCGLCNWELNHWKGYIVKPGGYPFPLGHEYAGTVVQVGANVTNFKVGDKVSGLGGSGAFAEYVIVKADSCVRLSDDVDPKYVLGEPVKCIVTVLEAVAPKAGDYGEIQVIRSRTDQQAAENDLPFAQNSRGIGPSEMAAAMEEGRPNLASSELALHVLDVIDCMMESSKTGAFVKVSTTCKRPEPLNGKALL
ncbi:MAG: alcohol dehydrogenase catalytic domain-containing protein [Oscillospiraceae bacterium]|nr:alcohol dehydrogenase catalytic domain-containing protein [Oscillospiraceae bacterium]